MGKKKFYKGLLFGALIGGTITLLDKNVRREVLQGGKALGNRIKETLSRPGDLMESIQGKVQHFRNTYEALNEDLQFLAEKAAEIKKLGEETAITIKKMKNNQEQSDEY